MIVFLSSPFFWIKRTTFQVLTILEYYYYYHDYYNKVIPWDKTMIKRKRRGRRKKTRDSSSQEEKEKKKPVTETNQGEQASRYLSGQQARFFRSLLIRQVQQLRVIDKVLCTY